MTPFLTGSIQQNSYGQGTFETTGAENHQPVCPVNFMATDAEKNDAECDRDEGDVIVRWNNAAQSYMEWMPVRRGHGFMGVIGTTSLTQVIEWGNLATIVGFDTRISHRSKGPTLQSSCKYLSRLRMIRPNTLQLSLFPTHFRVCQFLPGFCEYGCGLLLGPIHRNRSSASICSGGSSTGFE